MTPGQVERTLRIGTRGSALALVQAEYIADLLRGAGASAEIVVVKTPGDESSAPIKDIGVGVFVSALRDALAAGTVDVAVHSYKDLPTAQDPRLSLAGVPPREDPRDALVARDGLTLGELPSGAVIGTGSPRRATQLEAMGLGFEVRSIRGNVDTRIRKMREGQYDAVVVAAAGLRRIQRIDEATELLEPVQMVPAPAQGALAVECRCDDMDTEHLIASVADDHAVHAAVTAERAVLRTMDAGCHVPIGALAEVVEDLDDDGAVVINLSLRAVAQTDDGSLVRASGVAGLSDADGLGARVAAELLDLGALTRAR